MGRVIYIINFFLSSKVESVQALLLSIVAFKPIRLGQENSCGLRCKNKTKQKAPRLRGQTYKAAQTNRGDEIVPFLCLGASDAICRCRSLGRKAVPKQTAASWWLRACGEVASVQGHFRLETFLWLCVVAGSFLGKAIALSRSAARDCSSARVRSPGAGQSPASALSCQPRRSAAESAGFPRSCPAAKLCQEWRSANTENSRSTLSRWRLQMWAL